MAAQIQAKAQADMAVEQAKALLQEKKAVSDDQREMEIRERLELMKQGNVLHPANLAKSSILLQEEQQSQQQAMIQQQQAQEQQMIQMAEQQEAQRVAQEDQEIMEEIAQERQQIASDRLQGGPDASDIRRQEMEENAPTG